jgi:hypothetical protein
MDSNKSRWLGVVLLKTTSFHDFHSLQSKRMMIDLEAFWRWGAALMAADSNQESNSSLDLGIHAWRPSLERVSNQICFFKGALQQKMGDALTALVTNSTSVVISKTMSHASLNSPTAISSC